MFLFCNSWHHVRKALTLSEDFRESCSSGRRSKSKFILCSEKRLKFVRPLCACCHADNMYLGVIDWNIALYVNHLGRHLRIVSAPLEFWMSLHVFFSICRSLHDGILRSWVAPCSTVVTLRMFKTNLIIPYDRCPSHLTDRLRPVNSSRFMTSYVTSSTSAIMCGDLFRIGKKLIAVFLKLSTIVFHAIIVKIREFVSILHRGNWPSSEKIRIFLGQTHNCSAVLTWKDHLQILEVTQTAR